MKITQAIAVSVAVVASGIGVVVGAAPAQADTVTGRAMVATQFMSDKSLSSTQYATIPAGTVATLLCKTSAGQAVRGWAGGPDSWWYSISYGGRTGYIADVDWRTAANAPSLPLPTCGAPAPAPATTKATRAVSWANGQVGSSSYDRLCELFVENAYGTSGRYASAIAAYNALKAAGQIKTTTSGIPAGALVFSSYRAYDGGSGHVQISRGDGTFVSGGAPRPSTVAVYRGLPAGYLGWAYAPSSWPGR